MDTDKENFQKPEGLLDEADIQLISSRYGIQVDPDNLTQYRLCQVIKWLEQKSGDHQESSE